MPRKLVFILFAVGMCFLLVANSEVLKVSGWGNGGYSADITRPDYGTHDWIAEHALDWLPVSEKQLLIENSASYRYGTELPDNKNTLGGVGDTTKHHVYFYANGSLQEDDSAVRAQEEYAKAKIAYASGNLSGAATHLGMVAHYVADMSVFGHVMGATTSWGTETHHSDYEEYVGSRTWNYVSQFDYALVFDGNLSGVSAYDATVALARETTFGVNGTCVWMNQNYNWSDPTFKNRAGESLNLATNAVADVLHMFYVETQAASPTPNQTATSSVPPTQSASPETTSTPQVPEFPAGVVVMLVAVATLAATLLFRMNHAKSRFE